MKKSEAIKHFGGVPALAEALEISRQAIYLWGENVPAGRDYQIEVLTRGALKAGNDTRTGGRQQKGGVAA